MVRQGTPTREQLLVAVKKVLPPARYRHTEGVWQTALTLADRYGADLKQAETAAILHDYAKFRPKAEMERVIQAEADIPDDLLAYNQELWHAFVGAVLIRDELGITDQEVLDAIRYHTTGRANMTLLEKVIYLADYIEPGRTFAGVDDVRRLAEINLDQAVFLALKRTIDFLEGRQQIVYPLTREAYAALAQQMSLSQEGG